MKFKAEALRTWGNRTRIYQNAGCASQRGSVDAILDLRAEWYFVEDASIIADEHEGYTRTVLPHPEGG